MAWKSTHTVKKITRASDKKKVTTKKSSGGSIVKADPSTSSIATPSWGQEPNTTSASTGKAVYTPLSSSSGGNYSSALLSSAQNQMSVDPSLAPESQPGGWSNVGAVLNAAFNPFSKDTVVANVDNTVYKTALELMANHPYMAANILAGPVAIGWSLASRASIGTLSVAAPSTMSVATNTWTAGKTAAYLSKIVVAMKKPAYVAAAIGAMIGTYPWAEWALGEAQEGMIMNTQRALNTGDPALIKEYLDTQNEIFDMTVWEQLARSLPGTNIALAFTKKAQSLAMQKKVNEAYVLNEMASQAAGESEEQKWLRLADYQAQLDKDTTDYYNEQRKLMVQWELDARRRGRNKDAAFWLRYKEQLLEMERKAMEDQAKFWLEYKKTSQKMAENSSPSRLGFGLL